MDERRSINRKYFYLIKITYIESWLHFISCLGSLAFTITYILIYVIEPRGRPIVMADSDHYFLHVLYVRPSLSVPTFQNLEN